MKRQAELQRIAEEIKVCPLCKKGGTGLPVPGEGSGDVPVMFIGEAPGSTEARTGRPFVGRSGKFLREMIRSIGLDDTRVFITSPVHYLPVAGKPSPAMTEHGATHLMQQIDAVKPRVIVLLGNTACRALLGRNVEIAKQHGSVVQKDAVAYFISFHPAYAVRFPEGRKKFIEDFAKLKELLRKSDLLNAINSSPFR